MKRKKRKLSVFKFYNERKTIYIIWSDCEDALNYISDNEMFSKELFKKRKVPINSKIVASIDGGKNYFYINKILKMLDCKLSEPYILNNKYIIN
ncbi:hypothetical protein K5V21_12595 [Clostridium sardiniense]|uniref:Uncharacterized protein n=1 Tax=Clostridium sardiniense TaxID=29369 RepID=A0ABS7KZQ1_CLOSR|nr:hypothetical protein [Clostridium sardiniense]MBY0756286.1 hypothetical protein [Clostridium sardiniense]MDQ0458499.1 hypothetical protein [Clostridium sardiniense]